MDRISPLSDDLLIRILMSLAKTKHVLATSSLSKRWQHLWSLVPKLEYDDRSHTDDDDNYLKFTTFVYRSSLSNKAPVLESLYLILGPKCQAIDVGIWINSAVAHRVRSIKLDIYDFSSIGPISLPSSLYTSGTLETLILKHYIRLDIPSSVSLPSLKRLHVQDMDYCEDKGSLARLLSGCPKLERLLVKQDNLDVSLLVRCLKKLMMTNEKRDYEKGSGFVIDAPSLEYFHVEDDVHYDFHRIEYMPKLQYAYLQMTHGLDHKFLNAFTCVRSLVLRLPYNSEVLPSSPGMIFPNLDGLAVYTCAQGWWDLLIHMLQASPKLVILTLYNGDDPSFPSKETPDCWKRPSCVPKCLLNNLEVFDWQGYIRRRRGDREMAAYIIANATHLVKAILTRERSMTWLYPSTFLFN